MEGNGSCKGTGRSVPQEVGRQAHLQPEGDTHTGRGAAPVHMACLRRAGFQEQHPHQCGQRVWWLAEQCRGCEYLCLHPQGRDYQDHRAPDSLQLWERSDRCSVWEGVRLMSNKQQRLLQRLHGVLFGEAAFGQIKRVATPLQLLLPFLEEPCRSLWVRP